LQPTLHEVIRAVSATYPTSPVTVNFDALPTEVDGFFNHYLVVMLQPLVENAIEGCLAGGTVEVTFADERDEVAFTVYNPVDEEILFATERTTKNGHHGLGRPSRSESLNSSGHADNGDHRHRRAHARRAAEDVGMVRNTRTLAEWLQTGSPKASPTPTARTRRSN
jgi:hypothetical protein